MEESILQDKTVKRPNLARGFESELYDKQFMALGNLNPSAISVDEYDTDPSYDKTWMKDAYHTYNNSKDNIGIMTERGAILNEIAPKLRDLGVQESYQQTRQQLAQAQDKLRQTTVGTEEYAVLSNQVMELSNALTEQSTGYDDLVKRNGNKEFDLTDIQGQKESLFADLEDRKKRIDEYQADVDERAGEYSISDEFKEKEAAAHGKSIFDAEYWKYAVPGIVGSSMNNWKAMVGTAAASYAASIARTSALTTATALGGPGGIVAGNIAANTLAAATVVGNIYSTYYQRDEESLAQTFGAHKDRVKQQLSAVGVQDKQVVDAAREQAKQQGGNLDSVPDEEIIDRLVSGEMKTGNKQLDDIFQGNKTAINEVYRRNMALGISDLAQVVLVLPPVSGALKTVAKMATPKAVTNALNPTLKKAKRAIDFTTELGMKSNTTRAKVAKHAIKAASALTASSMLEGVEEGDQDVFDYNFSKGKYDNASGKALGTLLGVAEDKIQLAKIITGIDTKSELANDEQLWNDMKGGIAIGLLLSGGPVVGHTINDVRKDVKANNYVNGVVANQLGNKDKFIKAATYTNRAVQGKKEQVLDALEEYRKYKPDGITDADIDEEIQHAKDVFNAAENPLNLQLAKELKISPSSEQYGKLMGLQDYTRNKIKSINSEIKDSTDAFNNAMSKHKLDGVTIFGKLVDPAREFNSSPNLAFSEEKIDSVYNTIDSFSKNTIAKNAIAELIADIDSYVANNKKSNINEDLGISDKHIKTIRESLVERLNNLDEISNTAKAELTKEQKEAVENAVNVRVLRSKDAAKAYKQLSILYSALDSTVMDLNNLTGMVGDKFVSTLDKADKESAITSLSQYLTEINEGLNKNANSISELRKESEKKEEVITPAADPNAVPETLPKSVEDTLPPPPTDGVVLQSTIGVKKDGTPADGVDAVKPAVTPEVKPVTKPTEKPAVTKAAASEDPDSLFGEGDEDLDLSLYETEPKNMSENEAKQVLNIPTTPPTPQTKAPKSVDVGVLPDGVDEHETDKPDEYDESYNEDSDEDYDGDYDGADGAPVERKITTIEEAKAASGIAATLKKELNKESLNEEGDKLEGEADMMVHVESLHIDFMSSTLFFQPTADTPMNITIDGEEVTGHKSGKELSEKLKDPSFVNTAKYEFKIGTFGPLALPDVKSTWQNFAVLCYIHGEDGNTYVTAFRTPYSAQEFYEKYNQKPEIQALSEESKVLLFTKQQESITALIANRNRIIEAWFSKKKNEHIVPTTVSLSNGTFDVLPESRPVANIPNLGFPTPENCTPEHVKIGIGKGIRGGDAAFKIVNPADGGVLPGFGRSGDIYIYPTTAPFRSGKPVAVSVDKVKIGSIEGLSTFITNMLVYGSTADVNGDDTNISKNAFLDAFLFRGGLSIDDIGVKFLENKQIYEDTSMSGQPVLVVGSKSYPIGGITDADVAEIDKYIAENINLRVGASELYSTMSEIFPGLAVELETKDEIRFSKGFAITKEDVDLTYLGYLVKNGYLTSNISDNIFKDPFQYVDFSGKSGSSIAVVKTQPKPKSTKKQTEKEKDAGKSKVTKDSVEEVTNSIVKDVAKEVVEEKITFASRSRRRPGGAKYTNTGQSTQPIRESELKWLRNILGFESDKLSVVDNISGLLGSSTQVLGLMRQDSIQISTKAVRGVAYHEGYHRLSLLLLSNKEREDLYEQFAKHHNLYSADGVRLADQDIEEMMADDFANYMLNPIRRAKYLINKWYKALKHFVTKTSKLSDRRVEDVYHKFAKGGYKNVKENAESVKRFNELYLDGAPFTLDGVDFKYITNTSFKETVNALVTLMFDNAGFLSTKDVNNLSKEVLIKFLSPSNLLLLKETEDYTDSQIAALTEVYENFEQVFWPRIKQTLARYSLRVIDSTETMDEEADNVTSDSDNFGVSNDLSQHTKASVEISKKANAMSDVKILIATIGHVEKENGEIVSVINETTGLPVSVDFNTSWNKILNGLHKQSTYDGLLKECVRLSKFDLFFDSVYETFSSFTDENIRTKILNTISSSFHNMNEINVLDVVDDNGEKLRILELFDANVLRASRIYPQLWNGQLLEGELFLPKDEKFVPNNAKMTRLVTIFNKITTALESKSEDINRIKTALVSVLNSAGISIDVNTLNNYISNISDSENPHEQLLQTIQAPGKGNLASLFNWFDEMANSETGEILEYGNRYLDIYNFYGKIKALKDLAIEYANLNPNPSELSVLGAGNSMLYPISQHNYLSGTIDRLNESQSDVLDLASVTYVSGVKKGNRNVGVGSIIVSQMGRTKNPAKMKFHTMVNFKVKNSQDVGRKYTGISSIEDYIMKMCYVANDHIVLPTMGDSSMYNTISGITLLHDSGDANTLQNGKLQYQFSDKALDRMFIYFKTEYETILNNYDNEKFLDEHPERKVANYHTGTRNGYRFRYFNRFEFVDPKTDEIVVKDFDQMLIEAEKKDEGNPDKPTVRAQLEWIRKNFVDGDRSRIKRMFNDMLLRDFNKELKKVAGLGIIEYNGDIGEVTNVLLDGKRVAKRTEQFRRYGDKASSLAAVDLIADYFINSVVSTIEVEKIFIQDPAYYSWKVSKDGLYYADKSIDKIKRLREVLSTGIVPRTDFADGHELANKPNFNIATFNDNILIERQINEVYKKTRNSYVVDLLKVMHDTPEGSAMRIAQDVEHMEKYYPHVLDAAIVKTDEFISGYKKVNQTDATVLISPQMYRELVERVDGWSPELEKAFNLLNDSSANWDSNPQLYAESLALTLKPLKFMYFGEHIDHDLGLSVPVFDKMAMFPVHKIFSDGDMGHVLNLMNEKNIQMIAFNSAVKTGVRESMDMFTKTEDGVMLNPELNNIQVYEQQFRNLRRQLITDPHDSERQMFVTQAQKQAVGNIRSDRTYTLPNAGTSVSGAGIKTMVKRSLDALTVKGRARISERFGVTEEVDENGDVLGYNLDVDKFYAELKTKAENSDMNQNIIQSLTKVEGKSYVPLSSMSDNNWVESALTSIFNKEIIDVNLPGGMYIQMSSILYNRVSVGSDKHLTRQLNYNNEDGSMDCVISLNLLKHVLPKGNSFTFSEAKAWLLEHDVIGPNSKPMAMGYRIPAQGQSSLAVLKIVDIYPEQIGDTITLPDAFTTLTGSDFD